MMTQLDIKPLLGDEQIIEREIKDKRIALFCDDTISHTTGLYVKKALDQICSVRLYHPSQVDTVSGHYDLYLVVDDGSHYLFPQHLKPAAFWAIDTHLSISRDLIMAMNFDYIFCAQKQGVMHFQKNGFNNVKWLPLACDPAIHYVGKREKMFDVGFVGNVSSGFRRELLTAIKNKYNNAYIDKADHSQMAEIYAKSKIVFNISIRDDLNMRVFEGLCSGSVLLTDNISTIEELFIKDQDLFLYSSKEEALAKIDYLLKAYAESERVSVNGHNKAISKHTYLNRVNAILHTVFMTASHKNNFPGIIAQISKYSLLKRITLNKLINTLLILPWIDFDFFKIKMKQLLLKH